jgi:hypothetical protein
MQAQTSIDPSRRRLLLGMLLGMAAGGLGGCAKTLSSSVDADRSAQWLAAMTGEGDGMARFGSAYLRDFPAERDLSVLWHALYEVIERQGAEFSAAVDPADAWIYLDQAVRDEYRRADVVEVDGWLLSRSEARLYAAATLL